MANFFSYPTLIELSNSVSLDSIEHTLEKLKPFFISPLFINSNNDKTEAMLILNANFELAKSENQEKQIKQIINFFMNIESYVNPELKNLFLLLKKMGILKKQKIY